MTINKIKKHKIESNVFLSQTLILSLIFTLRLRLGRDIFVEKNFYSPAQTGERHFCREKFYLTVSDWGETFFVEKNFNSPAQTGE